jgi:hypothetical protein
MDYGYRQKRRRKNGVGKNGVGKNGVGKTAWAKTAYEYVILKQYKLHSYQARRGCDVEIGGQVRILLLPNQCLTRMRRI